MISLEDYALREARLLGAERPSIGQMSGEGGADVPAVVDDNGDVFVIELRRLGEPTKTEAERSFPKEMDDLTQLALREGWSVQTLSNGYLSIAARSKHDRRAAGSAMLDVMWKATDGSRLHTQALRWISDINQGLRKGGHAVGVDDYVVLFMRLRDWIGSSVVSSRIVRVGVGYDPSAEPGQQAVAMFNDGLVVQTNQDIVSLHESVAVPDITFGNSEFTFAGMTVHTDRRETPIACSCGACGHTFAVDPVENTNLKTVIVEGKRLHVARCANCGALAHNPKHRTPIDD